MPPRALEFDSLETLRRLHPAWRLLASDHAPFVLSFLHRAFIAPNHRSLSEHELTVQLDDFLFRLRQLKGEDSVRRSAREYLEEWTGDSRGWLRKYYPPAGDEAQFDLMPAAEKAIEWVASLEERQFVGTESRLLTVFELLRELAFGTQADPRIRIAELERRRERIEAEIAEARAGRVSLMDTTRIKERFMQASATARSLLSDFREVEQNFRNLDRNVRDRIATWEGGKGALLDEVFGQSDAIRESDQGRSFHAFWDFLMSPARQEELTDLLERVLALEPVQELGPDPRLRQIHFDWLQAGDQAQRTIARLSAQLRRYLDDQAALENRRIIQILRGIEKHAIAVRQRPPTGEWMGLDAFAPGLEVPMDRRLYAPPLRPVVESGNLMVGDPEFGLDALYDREYVDRTVLRDHIRKMLQGRKQISLEEVVGAHPLEKGLAELVGYLSLAADDPAAVIDESRPTSISWVDREGVSRQATLPFVLFHR